MDFQNITLKCFLTVNVTVELVFAELSTTKMQLEFFHLFKVKKIDLDFFMTIIVPDEGHTEAFDKMFFDDI